MKLYLIQHGLAFPKAKDPERPLSVQGETQTHRTAEYLKSRSIEVNAIWHSTKLRAAQTAEIIAAAIACGNRLARDDMNPNDPVKKFPEEILGSKMEIMMVGHLPFLQKLAGRLLTGSEESDIIAFKSSGVLCLDYDEKWQIDWLVPVEHM
jgi:phosphohistidine phosphatase